MSVRVRVNRSRSVKGITTFDGTVEVDSTYFTTVEAQEIVLRQMEDLDAKLREKETELNPENWLE